MFYAILNIIQMKLILGFKILAGGVATVAIAGAGIGIGIVFGSLILFTTFTKSRPEPALAARCATRAFLLTLAMIIGFGYQI